MQDFFQVQGTDCVERRLDRAFAAQAAQGCRLKTRACGFQTGLAYGFGERSFGSLVRLHGWPPVFAGLAKYTRISATPWRLAGTARK